jgi:hypothetical protein
MINIQKINEVGRIKFRTNMHNSASAFSLIMEYAKFSEFAIDGMWALAFWQQVYSVRYHMSVVLRSAKNSNRNRKIVIIISKENKEYSWETIKQF